MRACTRTFAHGYSVGRKDIILCLCTQGASREFVRRRDAGKHETVSKTSFDNEYTGCVQRTVLV